MFAINQCVLSPLGELWCYLEEDCQCELLQRLGVFTTRPARLPYLFFAQGHCFPLQLPPPPPCFIVLPVQWMGIKAEHKCFMATSDCQELQKMKSTKALRLVSKEPL